MSKSKSNVGKEKKINNEKFANTQQRWLKKMKRVVASFPNDIYAAEALARGVHPIRHKPYKKIWTSRAAREFSHMLRVVGLNGHTALSIMDRRVNVVTGDEKETQDSES